MKSHTTRFLSLVLALALSCSLCVPAFAVSEFTDVPETHWAYHDIMACVEQGTVTGFGDGTFKPDENVTEVQFIVMLTRTFYADDVSAVATPVGEPWYYPNIKTAEDNGLLYRLDGIGENPMSRYRMAEALCNVTKDKRIPTDVYGFPDETVIKDLDTVFNANHYNAVASCYYFNILTGMSDGAFHGEQTMTRAQACVVMQRLMNLIENADLWANGKPSTTTQPTNPDQTEQPQQPETPAEASTGKLANGEDITVDNVLAILEEIKSEYPTGTIWGDYGTANNNYYANGGSAKSDMANLNAKFRCSTGNYASLTAGCGGWACMITERIFGASGYPFREVTDPSKVRPGDIIVELDNNGRITHYGVATSAATPVLNKITGKTMYQFSRCDGNLKINGVGTVKWYDDLTGSIYSNNVRAFTRYPD